jgi:hypothetical protein
VRESSGSDGGADLPMTEREALDDYLDTITEAAKLHSPRSRPTDSTDVEPHHLSAELLDALSIAKNRTNTG